jgi:hypothetical protein
MTLFPNHERGTMILAELPNSVAIAVASDTWRVERRFNSVPLLACFIIQLYNHPQLYTFRPIVPIRLYKRIIAVFSFCGMIVYHHVPAFFLCRTPLVFLVTIYCCVDWLLLTNENRHHLFLQFHRRRSP